MTTIPNEPGQDPDAAPSADPHQGPDGLPEWDPDQAPSDPEVGPGDVAQNPAPSSEDAEPGQMPESVNPEVGA